MLIILSLAAFQFQTVSNSAKLAVVRIAGIENQPWDDNETNFEQLLVRIEKTIAFVKQAKPEQFEGRLPQPLQFAEDFR